MSNYLMPRLSDSMEEGKIGQWLKADGEHVDLGEALVEIEGDKATMLCEADVAGRLEIVVCEGQTVKVGTPIARIGPMSSAGGAQPSSVVRPAVQTAQQQGSALRISRQRRALATPLARRIAREQGIDLEVLSGSGPGGRICKRDVLDRAARRRPAPEPEMASPAIGAIAGLTRMQHTVARRMTAAHAIPTFDAEVDVDMSNTIEFRARAIEESSPEPAPTLNDLILFASARALRRHPRINASVRDGVLRDEPRIQIGIAVAAGDALYVPVIEDPDRLTLRELAVASRGLIAAAREGRLASAEMEGGTFTVSNLGAMGVDRFTAMLNPPQVAILAVGAVVGRPVVRAGEITLRPHLTMRLTSDHRVVYGADAAAFLGTLRALVEAPLRMLL